MGEVVIRYKIAQDDCRKNSTFDELMAQLQAENRILEDLLRRDSTNQLQMGVVRDSLEHL
jgi:hypothetical protein